MLYFVGCTASYVNKEIAQSTAKILKAAGTEFMLMPDEWCCGNTLFSVGLLDQAKALAQRNVEEVRKTGAKTLLLSCAEGYRMWKVDYPKLLNISTAIWASRSFIWWSCGRKGEERRPEDEKAL